MLYSLYNNKCIHYNYNLVNVLIFLGEKVAEIPVQAATFTVAWHPSRYLVAFACEDKEPPERKRDAGNLKLWGLSSN